MSPFVTKVSVEVDTLAETKGDRVGSPVLPPESVHGVRVLVPGVGSMIKLKLKQHVQRVLSELLGVFPHKNYRNADKKFRKNEMIYKGVPRARCLCISPRCSFLMLEYAKHPHHYNIRKTIEYVLVP